jgi:hypothetical protein
MSNETQYIADNYTQLRVFEDSDDDWYDDDEELAAPVIAEMYDTMNFKWDHCRDAWKNHVSSNLI